MGLPWIKLPVKLLDDVRFVLLSGSEEMLFYRLLLVAAELDHDGWLLYEFELARRLKLVKDLLLPRLEILSIAYLRFGRINSQS